MHQVGGRVRVLINDTWRLGIVTDPNHGCSEKHDCRLIEVYFGFGEWMIVRDDENIERLSSAEWNRNVFPQFCRDIVKGKFDFLDLTNDAMSEWSPVYSINETRLNDETAVAFADALRQTTRVKTLWLKSQAITDLGLQGLEVVAQGIASCPGLECIELFRLQKQSQVDVVCRNLGSCPNLKSLVFFECIQPSSSNFRELCKTCASKIQVEGDFWHYNTWHNPLKTDLYRFSSLISVALFRCPFGVVQSCLDGLVNHPSIEKLSVTYMNATGHNRQLIAALDRLLESRAQRNSLISLKWGSNVGFASEALVESVILYDALDTLNLEGQMMDATDAFKVESLLKSTRNLRRLFLPKANEFYAPDEGFHRILEGLRDNQSLRELSIESTSPERVLAALVESKNKKLLEMLSLRGGDPNEVHNFSQLRHLCKLRHLDVSGVSGTIGPQSFIPGLKRNSRLENIEGLGYQDEQIDFYLRLNRWCNGNSTEEPLETPETFAQGAFPHLLSKVSSNVRALNCLLRWYPAFVESSNEAISRRSVCMLCPSN